MTDLMLFENSLLGKTRSIFIDGEYWFVAKDVAEALGYVWKGMDNVRHVPEEWRGVQSVWTPSGNQDMFVLSEQGVYFFLGRSDKPKALPYQKWFAGEVMPSLRKTGSYSLPGAQSAPSAIHHNYDAAERIFRLAGLKDNQLVLALDKLYKAEAGVSALEQGAVVLEAPVKQQSLTPTQIARELGWGNKPREVNVILAAMGLQRKCGKNKWEPLDTDLAVMQDTNKWHGGAPVTQLKWRSGIISKIRDFLSE